MGLVKSPALHPGLTRRSPWETREASTWNWDCVSRRNPSSKHAQPDRKMVQLDHERRN